MSLTPRVHCASRAPARVRHTVTYVADDATAGVLQAVVGSSADVLRFPMGTSAASDTAFAERLLADVQPTLCASVERCGRNGDGKYLSCRGEDLGDVTARADAIFDAVHRQRELVATASEAYEQYRGCLLLAVGDGGNECGMGNVADAVRALRSSAAASDQELQRLPEKPCEVASDECLVGDTSNWTAYALAAAIEVGARAAGRTVPSLLPTAEQSAAMLQAVVDAGGVDGVTCEASATVDGFEPHVDAEVLARLARVRDEALERQAAH